MKLDRNNVSIVGEYVMGSNKKNYSKNIFKSIPTIIFNDCNELELLLGDWLGNNKSSYENMGLLMYKLGIVQDENVIIQICKYRKEDNSFYCIVDSGQIYQIRFKNLNVKEFNPEIEVSVCNEKFTYECIPMNMNELGMRVIQKSYSIYQNGITYIRYLSMDNALYVVDNGRYVLEFGVSKPKEMTLPLFDGQGNYSKYKLNNEEDLVSYLISLDYPLSVIDVYNDIKRISLGDVNEYPRLLLKISKKNLKLGNKVTDLIHINNGVLDNFGISVNGRVIMLDKDGNWSYESDDNSSSIKISLDENTNKINYNICVNNYENLDNVKLLVESNMNDANMIVSDTKRLVRKVFDKNIRSSN